MLIYLILHRLTIILSLYLSLVCAHLFVRDNSFFVMRELDQTIASNLLCRHSLRRGNAQAITASQKASQNQARGSQSHAAIPKSRAMAILTMRAGLKSRRSLGSRVSCATFGSGEPNAVCASPNRVWRLLAHLIACNFLLERASNLLLANKHHRLSANRTIQQRSFPL